MFKRMLSALTSMIKAKIATKYLSYFGALLGWRFNSLGTFLLVVKTHNIKFTTLTIFKCTVSNVIYNHIVQQISRTFSSCKIKILPVKNTPFSFISP